MILPAGSLLLAIREPMNQTAFTPLCEFFHEMPETERKKLVPFVTQFFNMFHDQVNNSQLAFLQKFQGFGKVAVLAKKLINKNVNS